MEIIISMSYFVASNLKSWCILLPKILYIFCSMKISFSWSFLMFLRMNVVCILLFSMSEKVTVCANFELEYRTHYIYIPKIEIFYLVNGIFMYVNHYLYGICRNRVVICIGLILDIVDFVHWWECLCTGIILGMGSANVRRRYIVMPPLIGWAHTKNDHSILMGMHDRFCFWLKSMFILSLVIKLVALW